MSLGGAIPVPTTVSVPDKIVYLKKRGNVGVLGDQIRVFACEFGADIDPRADAHDFSLRIGEAVRARVADGVAFEGDSLRR